jgi:hypothetical protein
MVQQTRSSAHVSLNGRSYDLQRSRSGIGVKYLSPTAALVIDGPSAVFVTENQTNLGTCTKALPVASR